MIEMGKEYKTRCGYRVRLYTTESRCIGGRIVGEYEMRPNKWVVCVWDAGGMYATNAPHLDLIEVKPVRVFERWYSMYADGSYITHNTRESASGNWSGRIACLHIRQEYREGDGLSS